LNRLAGGPASHFSLNYWEVVKVMRSRGRALAPCPSSVAGRRGGDLLELLVDLLGVGWAK
jgi:hypothetical protein